MNTLPNCECKSHVEKIKALIDIIEFGAFLCKKAFPDYNEAANNPEKTIEAVDSRYYTLKAYICSDKPKINNVLMGIGGNPYLNVSFYENKWKLQPKFDKTFSHLAL